jgi:hypothetical protein
MMRILSFIQMTLPITYPILAVTLQPVSPALDLTMDLAGMPMKFLTDLTVTARTHPLQQARPRLLS